MDKPEPKPGEFDAIVRPIIASACTSDVHHIVLGTQPPGRVMGHEGIGEVVEVGSFVKDFKTGDKVVIPATTPNWRSFEAQIGYPMHSDGLCQGCRLGSEEDGLFAEYTLIHDADMNLALIPDEMNLETAAYIGDMVTTGLSGAELAEVGFGETVVVMGIGPVGIMAVAGAWLKGAARIVGIGSRPVCVEAAKYYGATDIINYKKTDVVREVLEMTKGRGADRVIIASPGARTVNQALSMTRNGGVVANLNTFLEDPVLELTSDAWGYGLAHKTLKGGLCPGGRARMEYLISLIMAGRLDPTKLTTHKYEGIEHLRDAVTLMIEKPADLIKPIVVF
jgi:threonine dehydrogenase-like Zn-dependent dehydrogenase